MKKLEFKNPVFLFAQQNVTVRRGRKWINSEGETVELWGKGQSYGKALITSVYSGKFSELMDNNNPTQTDILRLEHDPQCHTIKGLHEAMKRAYLDFKDDDDVCVVEFWKT